MSDDERPLTHYRRFNTTRWSLVSMASDVNLTERNRALTELLQIYWYPVYAFVRRRGINAEEAQDYTQAFFAQMLDKNYLESADQNRGKFRTFLLTAVSRYISKERDKQGAQKRGGSQIHISLDLSTAEERYNLEPITEATPESIFESHWALTLLETVLDTLRCEYESADRGDLFKLLVSYLDGNSPQLPYRELGQQVGMSEGAVKVAIHRMRRRYGELLRQEVAESVSTPDQIEEEIAHLFQILSR